jgi:ribosome-binding factor A
MSKATESLGSLIREIVSKEIFQRISQEEYGILTVTDVLVTKDFYYADVFVSPLYFSENLKTDLRDSVYHIQQVLNKKLLRKTVPKIRFFIDEVGARLERFESL